MAEWLQDVDTGEYFRADELDSREYEVVPETETTPLNFAKGVGVTAMANIGSGVAGLIRAAEEGLGTGTNFGEDTQHKANYLREEYRRRAGIDGLGESIAYDALSSIGTFLPALATAPVGGMLGVMGFMGAQHAGEQFGEFRDRGAGYTESAIGGVTAGAVNAALERVGLGNLLNPGKTFLRKTLTQGLIEGSEEFLQGASDLYIAEKVTGEQTRPEEFASLPYQALVGSVAGVGQTAAVHPVVKVAEARKNARISEMTDDFSEGMDAQAVEDLKSPQAQGLLPGSDRIIGDDFTARDPNLADAYRQPALPPGQNEQQLALPSGVGFEVRDPNLADYSRDAFRQPALPPGYGQEPLGLPAGQGFELVDPVQQKLLEGRMQVEEQLALPPGQGFTVRDIEAADFRPDLPPHLQQTALPGEGTYGPDQGFIVRDSQTDLPQQLESFGTTDPIVQEAVDNPDIQEKLDRAKTEVTVVKGTEENPQVVAGTAEEIDKLHQAAIEQGRPVSRTSISHSLGREVTIGEHTPIDQIVTRPDLMQYRSEHDSSTGETEARKIRNQFQIDKSDVVIIWEPKNPKKYGLKGNQRYIIVNGHNRFAAASRDEFPFMVTHIIREADGVTVEEARAYGAEKNISEGNSSVEDATRFYRDYAKQHGQDAAFERAKAIGIHPKSDTSKVSRQSSTIAFGATDNTYTALLGRKITPDQAFILSKNAPNNEFVQGEAIRDALAKKDGVELENSVGALLMTTEPQAEQEGLFAEAIPHHIKKAAYEQVANQHRTALRDELNALSSARGSRPDQLAASGFGQITDPEGAQARIKELTQQLKRWSNWWNDPELKSLVVKESQPIAEQMVKETEGQPQQEGLFGRTERMGRKIIDDEVGATTFIGDMINWMFGKDGIDTTAEALGINTDIPNTNSQDFLTGGFGKDSGKKAGVISDAASVMRKAIIYPRTLAQKFPQFAAHVDTAIQKFRNRDMVGFRLKEILSPYLELSDAQRDKVDAALISARIKAKDGVFFEENLENLKKLGLSDAEAQAYISVRQMTARALATAQQAMIMTPPRTYMSKDAETGQYLYNERYYNEWLPKIQEWGDKIRSERFVPFSRFGRFSLQVRGKDGGQDSYFLFETKKERDAAMREWNQKGHDTTTSELKESAQEQYREINPEFGFRLQAMDPDMKTEFGAGFQQYGFPKHFKEAKLTPGYSTDLRRNLAEYIVGLSNWSSNRIAKHQFSFDAEQIDSSQEPQLAQYAQNYREYVLGHRKEMQGYRRFLATWYLTRPMTAIVNSTQWFTTTIPEMMNHMSTAQAYKQGAATAKLAGQYMVDSKKTLDKLKSTDPELAAALRRAQEDGAIAEEATRELGNMAFRGQINPGGIQRLGDSMMFFFASAEKFNRAHAFINGWKIAKTKGLEGAGAQKFAENFVLDTQYDYTKVNRPELARGRKSLFFVFRNFMGSWLRQLRNNTDPGRRKAAIFMLAHMASLGGVAAMPLFRELEKALEAAGYKPKEIVRKSLKDLGDDDGKIADALIYGLPTLGGLSMSNNIAFGELAPGIEQGGSAALVRLIGGVAIDLPQRILRAKWLIGKDEHEKAAEQAMPPLLRGLHQAYRAGRDDVFDDSRSRTLVHEPTVEELFFKSIGGSPSRLARAYEQIHSLAIEKQRDRDNKDINERYAKAIYRGDMQAKQSLLREIREHNANREPGAKLLRLNMPSVKRYLKGLKDRVGGDIDSAPKRLQPRLKQLREIYE